MRLPVAPHPVLAAAFSALDRASVAWALLRGEAELDQAGEDVDLLVASADRDAAARALTELGYLRLASWGRGSHRFFVTYDETHDTWVKIDMVTTLDFGPHGSIRTDTADACLARRRSVDGVELLHDEDRFWALLLHCILDRGDVPERHATPLLTLAASATAEGPLALWFTAHQPEGSGTARVLASARDGDWGSLVAFGRRMQADHRWRSKRSLVLRGSRAAARRMTKLRTLALEPGLTMALLGPDGAGKSTLAEGLARTFIFPVRSVYMGLYGAGSADRPPRGMIGRVRRLWTGYARALFHQSRGRLVVYDRFGYDALLTQPRATRLRSRVRRWLLSHAIPAPDVVVLLDASSPMLRARKQEQDLATLEAQRRAYLDLASRLGNVQVVPADRSADVVRRAVTAMIFQRYLEKRRGRSARTA